MLFLFFENLPSERMKKATVRAFESLIVHLIRYFSDESYLNTENVEKNEFVLCEKFSVFTKNKKPKKCNEIGKINLKA